MNFKDLALPLIARGIPVIPVQPGLKKCTLDKWQDRATTQRSMVEFWNYENPNYNVGCVGTPDGIVILDCDIKGLAKRIEQETGQSFDPTLTVVSAGKRCLHIYFKQTDRSRAIGNRKVGGLFDLQSNRKYVVGPGSVLNETGKTYDILHDYPIADFPDWLGDWIEKNSHAAKKLAGCEMSPVNDDFDLDDMIEFFGLDYAQMGNWYNFYRECPVAGYQHEQSKLPGFFFDGQDLGWNCWASGCPSNGWNAGKVVKFLNNQRTKEGLKPYPHLIWPEREPDWEKMNVELAEMPEDDDALIEDIDDEDDDPIYERKFTVPKQVVDWKIRAIEKAGESRKIVIEKKTDEPSVVAVAQPVIALDEIKVEVQEPEPGAPVKRSLREMPEDCMYGWLGKKTKELEVPLGFAYPSMLAMAAARVSVHPPHIRPTLYVCLLGPVGQGKSQAMKRAQSAFEWPNEETVIEVTPYSDRGLAKQLGPTAKHAMAGPSAWKLPETRLYVWDEMKAVMKKLSVPNATLADELSKLFYGDSAGGADKKTSDKIFVRLNILGSIPVDDGAQFTEIFGANTTAGLYTRFIFGLSPGWEYNVPRIVSEKRDPMPVTVPERCYDLLRAWRNEDPEQGRGRLGEIALRVAVITSGINHESTVSVDCMRAALNFMEWQEAIRSYYKPSTAEPDKESRCSEAIRNALMNWGESHTGEDGLPEFRSQKVFYKKGNWWRYGSGTAMRVLKSFVDTKQIEQESRIEDEGNSKKAVPTGRIRWVG